MNILSKVFVVMACMLFLSGCGTVTLLTTPSAKIGITEERLTAHEKIVAGQTTREEVRQLYGKPSRATTTGDSGSDSWEFYNLGWPYDSKMFFVLVNYKTGVVSNVTTQMRE